MAIAIALLLIVVGSVLFHWLTPWRLTPLASDWGAMDDTLSITIAITGVFFVLVNLFIVVAVWRYRHRPGAVRRAAYQPENPRLERWLIGLTTLGIVGLLAPGLAVYARYVQPPDDAMLVEVLGQQWQWRYRFPGAGGRLGLSDARHVGPGNPFGIDPADTAGQDDLLVSGQDLHLPLGRPVKLVLRSNDVLHDYFVPPMRARMNIVPGQVTSFWFTPTRTGRFEAMCAQLCGVGHPNMQGGMVIESPAAFEAWLKQQPSFAQTLAQARPGAGDPLAERGRSLAQSKGCVACHSADGAAGVGPTWKGLFGKTETMADGTTALVDEAYVKAFIRDPKARSVKGFAPVMPLIPLNDDELGALTAYIRALGASGAAAVPSPAQAQAQAQAQR